MKPTIDQRKLAYTSTLLVQLVSCSLVLTVIACGTHTSDKSPGAEDDTGRDCPWSSRGRLHVKLELDTADPETVETYSDDYAQRFALAVYEPSDESICQVELHPKTYVQIPLSFTHSSTWSFQIPSGTVCVSTGGSGLEGYDPLDTGAYPYDARIQCNGYSAPTLMKADEDVEATILIRCVREFIDEGARPSLPEGFSPYEHRRGYQDAYRTEP